MKQLKLILLKRGVLGLIGCLGVAALIIGVVTTTPSQATAAATRQLPIYCVQREHKICSLTFDAAWGEGRVRHRSCNEYGSHENKSWLPYFNMNRTTIMLEKS